jgi:hypothetical protein
MFSTSNSKQKMIPGNIPPKAQFRSYRGSIILSFCVLFQKLLATVLNAKRKPLPKHVVVIYAAMPQICQQTVPIPPAQLQLPLEHVVELPLETNSIFALKAAGWMSCSGQFRFLLCFEASQRHEIESSSAILGKRKMFETTKQFSSAMPPNMKLDGANLYTQAAQNLSCTKLHILLDGHL